MFLFGIELILILVLILLVLILLALLMVELGLRVLVGPIVLNQMILVLTLGQPKPHR